jgi:ribonuclease BN (tRNA processing enzyme)
MRLTILGSGIAIPNPGGASSGYLLTSGATSLLVDCGHGVSSVLQTVANLEDLTAVILSHMHPDHFFDLVPITYGFLFRDLPPIPLILPPGGRAVLDALAAAVGLEADFFSSHFALSEYDPESAQTVGDISISFAPTQHYISGWSMRFADTADPARSLVYTADTGPAQSVASIARQAQILLAESTLAERPQDDETPHGHMTAAEAGALAREAGAGTLVLTHFEEALAERLLRDARSAFGGPVHLARERTSFEV